MYDNNRQRNNDVSTQSVVMLLICALLVYIGNHIDQIEDWARDHWFFLALLGFAIFWGVKSFLSWKFKMKHSEMYERQMALEKMRRKEKYDE